MKVIIDDFDLTNESFIGNDGLFTGRHVKAGLYWVRGKIVTQKEYDDFKEAYRILNEDGNGVNLQL